MISGKRFNILHVVYVLSGVGFFLSSSKTKQNKTKNKQTNKLQKRGKKTKKDNPSRRNQPCNNLQKEKRKRREEKTYTAQYINNIN
jgi:hypothetical protein